MSVTCSHITSYFSHLSVYCGDNYVTLNESNFLLTSGDCASVACLRCRQDSGNEESTNASSSFTSAPMMVRVMGDANSGTTGRLTESILSPE